MNDTPDVRIARVALADALASDARLDEAARQLHKARRERGSDPPDGALLVRLADVSQQSGDRASAVSYLLEALRDITPLQREKAARTLVDTFGGTVTTAARELSDEQIRLLVDLAADPEAPTELAGFAAGLAHARGDQRAVDAIVARHPSLERDPQLSRSRAVEQAWAALLDGEPAWALDVLDEFGPTAPDVAAVRAFSRYALDELQAADDALADAPPTFLTSAAKVAVLLRRASRELGEVPGDLRDAAVSAATEAARHDEGAVEALLLRAQAMLEAGSQLSEARLLLDAFVRHELDPATVRWWAVQRHVRDDDRFRFVQVELAASRRLDEEVIGLVNELPLSSTSYMQDGAIAARLAEAHERREEPAEAARRWRQAASFFDLATPAALDEQIDALHRARALDASPQTTLDLVDARWRRSYGVDPGTDMRRYVEETLSLLDDAETVDPQDVIRAAYLRGLTMARISELDPATPLDRRWRAASSILAKVLADRSEPYSAGHLSWALDAAGLDAPALHAARLAWSRDRSGGEDRWLQECLIAMTINWWGALDDTTDRLFDLRQPHGDWERLVLAVHALLDGDIQSAADLIDASSWDTLSGMQWKGLIAARRGDLESMAEAARSVLELATATGDEMAAGDALLQLQRPGEADERFSAAVLAGTVCEGGIVIDRALVRIADGRGADLASLIEHISSIERPFVLSAFIERDLAVLVALHGDDDGVRRAAELVDAAARRRLAEIEQRPLPPLGTEVDAHRYRDIPAGVRDTTIELLRALEAQEAEDDGSLRQHLALAAATADPDLSRALHALVEDVLATSP